MLQKVKFAPGFNKQVTATGGESQWVNGDNVRFRYGTPEKIGGWSQLGSVAITGRATAIHHFVNTSGIKYAILGTNRILYAYSGGIFYDIHPIKATTSLSNAFSTTNGSKTVTLTFASAHNINKFDIILLDTFTAITGSDFVSGDFTDKKFMVTSIPTDTTLTIEMESNESGSGASTSGGIRVQHYYPVGPAVEVSQGSVSSSASSSCLSSLSTLRLPWTGLPVQGPMLWPLHGSAGLHQGHGSCFSYTPLSRYPYASIPRRLVGPVLLSGVSPDRSSDCPRSVSRVGDCHQSIEVQPRTFPGGTISRGRYRLHLFQGFSISGTRHAAAVNSRRISILRLASRELVALAAGRTFFAGSPRSWRPAEDAFPPALPPSFLDPSGYGGSYLRVDGVSSRSPVVAPSPSSLPRRISAPSLTRPSLLVRRLGRGLGRPPRLSGRFRPVGRQSGSVVNQLQGTPSCSAGIGSSSSQLSRVARWLSSATTPQRSRTFAGRVAPDLLSSTA